MVQVCTLEACLTDIHWFPSMSQRQRSGAGTDVFVAACTDEEGGKKSVLRLTRVRSSLSDGILKELLLQPGVRMDL